MSKRIKTPTILQMEATECGAVALAIVLAYYGKYVSLEEMRVACGVSRDGSNAANMLKAARQFGLTAQGAKVEIEGLESLKLPVILYWRLNHFVILEGIEKNSVYINDPAQGRRKISWQELDISYTGIILILKPASNFQPGGKPPSLWQAVQSRLQNSRFSLLYILFASILMVIPATLIAGFSKIFIDNILIQQQTNWLSPLIIAMFATAIIQASLIFLQRYHLLRLQIKIISSTTVTFLWHVLHLPLQFFQQRFSGDIGDRVNANDRLAVLLSNEVTANIVGVITMIFFAIVMLLLDWQIALLGIVATTINFFLFYFIAQKIADLSRLFLQERGKLTGIAMNNVQLIEMIKASAMEDKVFERFAGQHAKTIDFQQQIATYSQILLVIAPAITGITFILILALGSLHIMQGILTVGTFIALQSLLFFFNQPMIALLDFATNLQRIRGDLMRLDDIMDNSLDPRQLIKAESLTRRKNAALSIAQLSFGYSPTAPALLENINLTAKPGDFIALVGATGSGKSTLAKLISGLYQPWSGNINLNEEMLAAIPPENLAKILGLVDQDIFLFAGTVRDNLSLWREIPNAELNQALHDACIFDEIQARGGLDASVIEGGNNWSGGQRQRIEIARALVNNPEILILDEATAAINLELEQQILANLRQRGCTVLAIAHRLSAIKAADQIYVMEQGKIIEHGTHTELLQMPNSVYQRLLQLEEKQ